MRDSPEEKIFRRLEWVMMGIAVICLAILIVHHFLGP